MDDYSTKIKLSAENLIRIDFPEKALELDKLVSVGLKFFYFNLEIFCIYFFKESSIIIQ